MEIHTFSSLNKEFLKEYHGKLSDADIGIVYYSPAAIAHKRLPELTERMVKESFGDGIIVFDDNDKLSDYLLGLEWKNSVLLMMSSGNYGGMNLEDFAVKILNQV